MALDVASFTKSLKSLSLFTTKETVLVAVSGGLDSVVLCHLLKEAGQNISIAHVNYGLRGIESDLDEAFVETLAKKLSSTFYLKKIDAKSEIYNATRGVQEVARDIRYRWFSELIVEHKISFLLTAHHKNDQAETMLHQFLRGGFLSALRGMKSINGNVVRPLLSFSREEILSYAKLHGIAWREDASNSSKIYTRNKIRHEVLPILESLNPALVDSLAKRAALFSEAEQLVNDFISKDILKFIHRDAGTIAIPLNWLKSYSYKHLMMWQLLEPFNFSTSQVYEALQLIDAQKGSRIESSTHQIWRESENMLITERLAAKSVELFIDAIPATINLEPALHLTRCNLTDVSFEKDQSKVFIDFDKLVFPLVIRNWREGDRFVPLGMKGNQKLSDFLMHQHVETNQKQSVLVLESGGQIAAVIGYRISENFRIAAYSREALRIVLG